MRTRPACSAESTAKYRAWITGLASKLDDGAHVLDLGCGAGVPTARLLTDAGYTVTGIDVSDVQIARARTLVPAAQFIVANVSPGTPNPVSSTPS